MLKKTIKYTDYNGIERTEDFYFNLTKSELAQMQLKKEGDYAERLRAIAKAKDMPRLMELFESIILDAYGEKSDDGKRFVKVRNGHRVAEDFIATPAYDELYFELIQSPEKFADFLTSLLPPDLAEDVKKLQASGEIEKELI